MNCSETQSNATAKRQHCCFCSAEVILQPRMQQLMLEDPATMQQLMLEDPALAQRNWQAQCHSGKRCEEMTKYQLQL